MKAASALVAQQPTGSISYQVARSERRPAHAAPAPAAANAARFEAAGISNRDAAPESFSLLAPGFIAALLMLVALAGIAGWMLRQLFSLWFG
jgi:hypothetical protein